MTKKNRTITITVDRRTLDALFAGGNHSNYHQPLAEGMKANLLEHSIWFTGLLHDANRKGERFSDSNCDFYQAMLFEQAQYLIEAVEEAEAAESERSPLVDISSAIDDAIGQFEGLEAVVAEAVGDPAKLNLASLERLTLRVGTFLRCARDIAQAFGGSDGITGDVQGAAQ